MMTQTDPHDLEESFRDSIATVDEHGKRVWLYPKKPKGRYYEARKWVSYLLIALFFSGPFIRLDGEPFMMFNVLERKFYVLGKLFLPHDFHLFVLGMILFMIFVVLFTVVYGRVWCGWACPQTVFMEMVFRRIEYWIEGDAGQQRKLNAAPWTTDKVVKKVGKQAIFVALSLLISNMALGYLFGGYEVLEMISGSPLDNWGIFVGHLLFAAVFYAIFARFREQACIAVCPYGRLQGVFFDKDTVAISYDYQRGEPRGKIRKTRDLQLQDVQKQGDCIDCNLCVAVCPTGIDIRNGAQLECVACTACIDACDEVMDKVQRPRGLIRYASANNVESGKHFHFTTRMRAYTVVLMALVGVIGYMLSQRGTVEATILRSPGALFQRTPEGTIRNIYTIQVMNKTSQDLPITVRLANVDGKVTVAGGDMLLKGSGKLDGAFLVDLKPEQLTGRKTKLEFNVFAGEELVETISTNFLGPVGK